MFWDFLGWLFTKAIAEPIRFDIMYLKLNVCVFKCINWTDNIYKGVVIIMMFGGTINKQECLGFISNTHW